MDTRPSHTRAFVAALQADRDRLHAALLALHTADGTEDFDTSEAMWEAADIALGSPAAAGPRQPAAPRAAEAPAREHPDICMASGEPVWFLHPERTRIIPADLRTHLPRVCRYNGALPWSDLQHLALCVQLARSLNYRDNLLAYVAAHDLHEAVVGDLPTHLKRLLPNWKPMEDAWEGHVHRSLGLAWPAPQSIRDDVKHVDKLALAVEMDCLGHVMAAGVAERRGVVVTDTTRLVFVTVAGFPEAALWRVLCEALPALGNTP